MINKQDKLLVFENFMVDRGLPKFQSESEKGRMRFSVGSVSMSEDETGNDFGEAKHALVSNVVRVMANRGRWNMDGTIRPHYSLWHRFMSLFRGKLPQVVEVASSVSVEEFFTSVKNSAQELVVVKERAAGYEKAMLDAKNGGQTALLESLVAGLNAHRMETQLFVIGMKTYVREEDIVRFYQQSEKGLRLDWVRNYIRTIPDDVLQRKVRADELGIFDNYVILHYDPKEKSFAETEAEKAKRKDPILFGLIKDRRVLYFVGDWKDELCDLTLDQIADKLGKEVVREIA
jgi:hypothetical protein